MSMIFSEFRKIFIKNRMGLLAVAIILLSLASQLGANTYTQFDDENAQRFYMSCMEQLGGEYTDEKGQLISQLQADYNNSPSALAQLEADYSENKISSEEYFEKLSDLTVLSSYGNVVDTLSACKGYVLDDTENHYFIDYVGWTQVFQSYDFDFLLLIFVLIISVNCVTVEQSSDMTVINSVSVNGRKYIGKSKIITVLGATVILTFIIAIIHYLVYASKYNLTGWDYPLQSLKSYEGATKSLTIGNAYLLAVLIKAFGYCSFSAFAMFFTALFKKAVPAMTVSLAIILIPMYILDSATEGQLRYLLPLPIGAMMSTGYISGTQKMDFGEKYLFREVTNSQMLVVFIILFIVSLAMLIFTGGKLSGKRLKLRSIRKSALTALSVVTVMSMSACSSGVSFDEPSDDYVIVADTNLIYSKSDGRIIKADEIPTGIPSTVCFLSGNTAVLKSDSTISLLDLDTLDKFTIAQTGKSYDLDGFLGMEDLFPSISSISVDLDFQNFTELVGGYKNHLYFSSQSGITVYDISGNTTHKLIDGSISEFRIKDGYAYYVNSGKLTKMNLDTGQEEILCNNRAEIFAVCDDDIYYTNSFDNGYVYSVKYDKAIFEKACNAICYNGSGLVCCADEGVYLVENGNCTLIKKAGDEIFITADEEKMYFLENSETPYLTYYGYDGSNGMIILFS